MGLYQIPVRVYGLDQNAPFGIACVHVIKLIIYCQQFLDTISFAVVADWARAPRSSEREDMALLLAPHLPGEASDLMYAR